MPNNEDDKFRYFAGFVYRHDKDGNVQISFEELESKLIRSFGDFLISPLHAPDEEQSDDHWHVVYKHPSTVTLRAARKFLMSIDVPFFNDYFICLHHPSNYQRYLVHLDNPDKEQFDGGIERITVINNFPLNVLRDLSLSDKMQIQREIESLATEYNVFEYSAMTNFLSKHKMDEHYIYFTTHTHHFGKFLDSLRYMAKERQEVDLDA